MQRHASTPGSRSALEGEEDVVGALHAGHPADPTDDEAISRDPEAAPLLGAVDLAGRRCAAPSSIPSRMTANFSAGATPSFTRSSRTCGLTAISAVEIRASQRSSRRNAVARTRVEVAPQDMAVEGVDDDRRPRVSRRGALRAGRRRPPSPCACAGCAAAPSGSAARARAPSAGRAAARSHATGLRRARRRARAPPRRTPSSPRRGRATLRRASSRTRAPRALRRGTPRAAPARPC